MTAVADRLSELKNDDYVTDIISQGPVFEDPIHLWVSTAPPSTGDVPGERASSLPIKAPTVMG